ncbi:hypothetical protein Y032_0042g561 [Ancylostoma ceylanicum]|uniref:Uncharacterized protein n=1 Tax=Ancylostoma ceylanicum TaxID=53326 RepID=A0A016UFZ4_9BILA|nr:hypothetical protein Y032_0042g561 [Ancylostoma ceylanicum]
MCHLKGSTHRNPHFRDTSVLKPSAESLGVTPLRNVAYRCGFLFVLHVEKEMQYSGPHEYVGQALGRKRRHF